MAGYSSAGVSAEPFVRSKLELSRVVLFIKSRNPSCVKILKLLAEYRMSPKDFEICDIQSRQDCSQIDTYFQQLCLTDRREVCTSLLNHLVITRV